MSDEPGLAVVGAGSWGTAFAAVVAGSGVPTVVWARREDLADAINGRHENPVYLPGLPLPEALAATHDLERAVSRAGVVAMAIPSHAYRAILRSVLAVLPERAPVVSLSKGIEEGTLLRMTEVTAEEGDLGPSRIAVLSGPNLAKEVVRGQPSATVVACEDEDTAARLQSVFMGRTFRVYTNPDVTGVELGGAMKNVIAIAAGIAAGMGFGDNARASLMTRGLAEIARLGQAMGGNPLTFAGLAGMGDLIATCSSPLSRNRSVGEQLAAGRALDEIVEGMQMVAEGVKTARPLCTIAARLGVDAPIADHVVRALYEGLEPKDLLASLMLRDAKPELHGLGH